jgi:hypothetical protein
LAGANTSTFRSSTPWAGMRTWCARWNAHPRASISPGHSTTLLYPLPLSQMGLKAPLTQPSGFSVSAPFAHAHHGCDEHILQRVPVEGALFMLHQEKSTSLDMQVLTSPALHTHSRVERVRERKRERERAAHALSRRWVLRYRTKAGRRLRSMS